MQLELAQQKMRERQTRTRLGKRLTDTILTVLTSLNVNDREEIRAALQNALPTAIKGLEDTILSDTTTLEQKIEACNSIFGLFQLLTKADIVIKTRAAQTEQWRAERMRAAAEKKQAAIQGLRDAVEADKIRRKNQRILDKAKKNREAQNVGQ